MKYLFLIITFSSLCCGQNFKEVDSIVKLYPKDFNTIKDLASKIKTDFSSNENRSRATFFWISNSIYYDVEFSEKLEQNTINAFSFSSDNDFQRKLKEFNLGLAIKTFNSKKAVCHGYSALFNEVMNKLGIESKLIVGNLKCNPSQIGAKLETNHAWNIVKIDDQYKFIDCTLAAGTISSKTNKFSLDYNDSYFFTDPELFYLNHYPKEEEWLLVKNKTKSDYQKLPLFFAAYLNYSPNLILPLIGKLSSEEEFKILLNQFDYERDYLQFFFSNEKSRTKIEISPNQENVSISLLNKKNQVLYLFINSKPLAAYLVE